MTREEFEEIFKKTNSKWKGDNVLKGLLIIAKYYKEKDVLIGGADHDIIYSVNVEALIEKGITGEDVTALAKLNWHIEEDWLAVFV